MPRNETHLDRKLRQLGLSPEKTTGKKHCFKLYFPRPPYDGSVEYRAAKIKDGYNFVGLLLGHKGATLQRIQKLTGTKIEIHDSTGNLNGTHPDVADPTLHARIIGDSKDKLAKAVQMVADALQPLNTTYERIHVDPNGSGLLTPIVTHLLDGSSQGGSDSGNSCSIMNSTESENSSFFSPTPENLSPRPPAGIADSAKNAWSVRSTGGLISAQNDYLIQINHKAATVDALSETFGWSGGLSAKYPASWSTLGGITGGDLWSFQPGMTPGAQESYGSLAWPSEYSPFGITSPTGTEQTGVYDPLAGLGISLTDSLNTASAPLKDDSPWSQQVPTSTSTPLQGSFQLSPMTPGQRNEQISTDQYGSPADSCINHLMELLVTPNAS